MFFFAILFGLSMDYQVFLVSRIHEACKSHGDNRRAVAEGMTASGPVITAAAAIMVLVFCSFIFGGDRPIQIFASSAESHAFAAGSATTLGPIHAVIT